MRQFLCIGRGVCRPSLLVLIKSNFSSCEVCRTPGVEQALPQIRQDHHVDLLMIDEDTAGLSIIDQLKLIRSRDEATKFALISDSESPDYIKLNLSIGFHGVILRQQPDDIVISAIKQILLGRIYAPSHLSEGAAGAPPPRNGGGFPLPSHSEVVLTPRQKQVLHLLSQGMSNKEIAHALHIAESTAKIHTSMLMRALRVRNRTEAAFKAGKLLSTPPTWK